MRHAVQATTTEGLMGEWRPTWEPERHRGDVDPDQMQLNAREELVRNKVREFISSGLFEPPPLPTVANEILGACSGGAGASQLAEIAHRDAFIAGRVLKLANSAFFQRGAPARTLSAAIVRVGQDELRNLVLTVVLKGTTFNVREGREYATLCWRHSLACALASSLLASETGWAEPHRAFLAGLLHDVGKGVVLHAMVHLARDKRSQSSIDIAFAPVIADSLHTMVGGIVAKKWRLDDGLHEVITLHHAPVDARVDKRLCSLVAFADAMTAEVGFGPSPALPDIATHPVRVFMGIDEDRLWEMMDSVLELMARYDVA